MTGDHGDGGGGELPYVDHLPFERKNPKFPLHTPQRPQPVFDTNKLFVVMSAHTLLGPFILQLGLVDQTLCLDHLYS